MNVQLSCWRQDIANARSVKPVAEDNLNLCRRRHRIPELRDRSCMTALAADSARDI